MKKLNVNINGNKKLQNTDSIRYMIWNLPAVKTCPFSTEHCRKSCYALKAERLYKQVLPCREQNYNDSLESDFVENMIFTIENYLNSKSFLGKKCVFRIHESGDFYSLEYTKKWVHIARHFQNDNRIVFLAYTKSLEYIIQAGYGSTSCPEWFPKNFVVRSSLWDDTCDRSRELTEVYNFPIYTALSREDIEKARQNGERFTVCTCENCSTCGKCWSTTERNKNIIVKIH